MVRSVRVEHPRSCTKSRMAMDEGEAGNVIFLANCTGTCIQEARVTVEGKDGVEDRGIVRNILDLDSAAEVCHRRL